MERFAVPEPAPPGLRRVAQFASHANHRKEHTTSRLEFPVQNEDIFQLQTPILRLRWSILCVMLHQSRPGYLTGHRHRARRT